jgi:cbb3-type cytochrome oxidase subunit 3
MQPTDALIAMIGMLVTFGLPLLLVVVILYYKHRKLRMTHETIARLAEKGLPVPPELLDPPMRSDAGLRGGLVLVAVGISLAIFLYQVGAPWSLSLIPGLMGVALLIAWRIERKRR